MSVSLDYYPQIPPDVREVMQWFASDGMAEPPDLLGVRAAVGLELLHGAAISWLPWYVRRRQKGEEPRQWGWVCITDAGCSYLLWLEAGQAARPALPWSGPAWEALQPRPRKLLAAMIGREAISTDELVELVWGEPEVSAQALYNALSRANRFLLEQEHPQTLHRRGDVVRWG